MVRITLKLTKSNTLLLSLGAIATVFVVEFTVGLITGSMALLADSMHAVLDTMITFMLLIVIRIASKPRDVEHTYGHGKIENLASFTIGIVFFFVAIFIIYESFTRLTMPLFTPNLLSLFAVLYALAIAMFRIIILKSVKSKSEVIHTGLYDAILDTGSTVAALAGIMLANYGIYATDSISAIFISAMLLYLSSKLVYRNGMMLTDAINPNIVNKVRSAVLKTEGVTCKDVKMRRSGENTFIELTVSLSANMSFDEAHLATEIIEENIRKVVGDSIITIHFEPEYNNVSIERLIRDISTAIDGVRGVHNISVSKMNNEIFASLHIQVNRDMKLTDAHRIADNIEERLKKELDIKNVTVHIEPYLPDMKESDLVIDADMEEKIRNIIMGNKAVRSINKVTIYRNCDFIKLDIACVVDDSNIEYIHDQVSDIERRIRNEFQNAIVTIHSEPST